MGSLETAWKIGKAFEIDILEESQSAEKNEVVWKHACFHIAKRSVCFAAKAFCLVLVCALFLIFNVHTKQMQEIRDTIVFLLHWPLYAPTRITTRMYDAATEESTKRPLYVLSGSDERWNSFEPPRNFDVRRIMTSADIEKRFRPFIDLNEEEFKGTIGCAIGHMYIWQLIEENPDCAHELCLVSEDDIGYPDVPTYDDDGMKVMQPWDPRPIFDLPSVQNADIVTFHQVKNLRLSYRQKLWGRENIIHAWYGFGTVSYALSAHTATALLKPFRDGAYRLGVGIDIYLLASSTYSWTGLDSVESDYPGWGVIHKSNQSIRTSVDR